VSSSFKYFVLLANMRTGSNLFEQNIRLYKNFSCNGELFNPHFIGFPNTLEAFDVSLTERELKPQKLLNRMIAKEGQTISGFRLFSDHDQRILDHCLSDIDCAKIVLTRNPLDSFVSHAIARATDQWKLTDISKRKMVKVRFDILEFKTYLYRLESFLGHIKKTLQKTGQSAFFISFDDLNDVDVFNGLAKYLGSDEALKDLSDKIVRQNPESLQEKVENYSEMIEQVRMLDLLGTDAVPILEQVRNPGSKNFVAGSEVPLLFMAMEKGELPEVADWVAAHQSSFKAVETDMNQKQLNTWLANTPVRQSFTVLRHPLERAYNAFYDHIFCSGEKMFPWIRNTLENHYGVELPEKRLTLSPNRSVLENSGYTSKMHGRAFFEFLKFLKGNLQGQTRARVDQSWASQNTILQGYCRLVFPDVIVRYENLAAELARIEKDMQIKPQPVGRPKHEPFCYSLADIYSDDMEKVAREVYARDYQMFGFGDWG
jgi:hypothetical protein